MKVQAVRTWYPQCTSPLFIFVPLHTPLLNLKTFSHLLMQQLHQCLSAHTTKTGSGANLLLWKRWKWALNTTWSLNLKNEIDILRDKRVNPLFFLFLHHFSLHFFSVQLYLYSAFTNQHCQSSFAEDVVSKWTPFFQNDWMNQLFFCHICRLCSKSFVRILLEICPVKAWVIYQ